MRAVPGVASASLVNRVPLSGGQTNSVHFETASGTPDVLTTVDTRTVSPEYFSTLAIRLIAGRGFTEQDADAPEVAIVGERVARTMWPGEMAVGKRFKAPAWRGGEQRIREFGIRVALGATRRNVSRLVVWQGVSMAVLGSVVGVVLAIAATRIMANVVYGVASTDVTSFLGATALLLLVAALASYVPSRRAAAIDPVVILRAE